MSNRPRRDGDRRPSDRGRDRDDRRDSQPDEEQQRRPGDLDMQESDSLTALKAILGKVAGLLTSLKLTQDECTSLVEQLYGSVLDTDVRLAGETDEKRKTAILAHIQNTSITRSGGKLVVEFPKTEAPKTEAPKAAKPADAPMPAPATDAAPEPEAPPAPEPEQMVMSEPTPEPAAELAPVAEPSPEPAPEAAPDDKPSEA